MNNPTYYMYFPTSYHYVNIKKQLTVTWPTIIPTHKHYVFITLRKPLFRFYLMLTLFACNVILHITHIKVIRYRFCMNYVYKWTIAVFTNAVNIWPTNFCPQSFGWESKDRGPVSQQVWPDKDPSLLKGLRPNFGSPQQCRLYIYDQIILLWDIKQQTN